MDALILFIAINTALALVYAIVKACMHEPGKGIGLALFFICLPGLGFVVYFLPVAIQSFLTREGVDREAILAQEVEVERQPEHPDIREALNVVPVGDAMAVGDNTEKRTLVLKELEKDWRGNFDSLLPAKQDDDSETAHYVAAEEMQIYRIHQTAWLEARKDYEKNPNSPKAFHKATDALMGILGSDAFSHAEKNAYRKRLLDLVQNQLSTNPSVVSEKEYAACLKALVKLERYDEAKRFWDQYSKKMPVEDAYRDMLKMYYQLNDRQGFEAQLNALREDDHVRLSAEGLRQMRYWTARLEGKRVAEELPESIIDEG